MSHSCARISDVATSSHPCHTHVTHMFTQLRMMLHLAHVHISHSCSRISNVETSPHRCQTHVHPTQMSHLAHGHVILIRHYLRCRILLTPMSHPCAPITNVAFCSCPCHTPMCTHLSKMSHLAHTHDCQTHVHPTQMSYLAHAHLTLICACISDVAFTSHTSQTNCNSCAPNSHMSHLADVHLTLMSTHLRCRI